MDLQEALYRGITLGRSPATEGRSVASMVHELESAGYGPKLTPEGISARTWRRLRADPGRGVAEATRRALRAVQRRVRLKAAREAKLRQPYPGIELRADVQISETIQYDRLLHVGQWRDALGAPGPHLEGMLNPVLDAWLGGDDDGAEGAFLAPIAAHIGAPVIITNVTKLRLGVKGRR